MCKSRSGDGFLLLNFLLRCPLSYVIPNLIAVGGRKRDLTSAVPSHAVNMDTRCSRASGVPANAEARYSHRKVPLSPLATSG